MKGISITSLTVPLSAYLFVYRAGRRIPAVPPAAPAPDAATPPAAADQPAAQADQRALAPVRVRGVLDLRPPRAPRALLRTRISVDELRVADGEVALEGEHDVAED